MIPRITRSLSDIANIISGGTPKTNCPEYWNGEIPWLSVKDFNNESKYVYKCEKYITNKGLENSAANLLQPEDIVISARGTVGALTKIPRPMATNQSCFGIRARLGLVDQDYLYYAIRNSITALKSLTQGSVFSTINRSTFDAWKIELHTSLEAQKTISIILSAIDKKIELNSCLNDYLVA